MVPLPSRVRIRPLFANLLLMLGITLALLLVIEVVLNRTHVFGARRAYVRPDPFLRYRFQPNAPYWFHQENDHAISGHINSAGWRDRERTTLPDDNVYRIATLGDSYVEALQVEADSTFLLLSEDHLNRVAARNREEMRFEFLNFGRSGFTQSEEWLVLLQDIPNFRPNLVALFFYPGNDIRDIHPDTATEPHRPYFTVTSNDELILDTRFRDTRQYRLRTWLNPVQRHSALLSLVIARSVTARQAKRIQAALHRESATVDHIAGHRSLATQNPLPQFLQNYTINKRLITRMAEFCRQQNMDFLVVCMQDVYKPDGIAKLRAIDPSYDPHYFENDLQELAVSLQVHFLGLQSRFETAARDSQHPLRWVHWNYAGHRIVARSFMDTVQSISGR